MNAFAQLAADERPFAPYLSDDGDQPAAWGLPDMSMVRANRSPAAPFPGEVFGDLWPLVQDLAEGAGSPVDYVATGILSVVASLVGAKRWVKPWEGWEEPCVIWVGSVGDPSSGKSPGLDAVVLPLRGMELDLADQHKAALMSYAAVAERANAENKLWQDKGEERREGCGSDTREAGRGRGARRTAAQAADRAGLNPGRNGGDSGGQPERDASPTRRAGRVVG